MLRRRIALVSAALLLGVVVPALAGPLRPCCSKKNAFCVIPARNAAACTQGGGTVFQANACIRQTLECGVAQQQLATGVISLQPQAGPPDTVNLSGKADVIDTELIMLDLVGVGPIIGPIHIKTQDGKASTGTFTPNVDSFFDVFFDIGVSSLPNALSNPNVLRITASPVGMTFPPIGTPYNSSGGTPLLDRSGSPAGSIIGVSISLLPFPDADGDGVTDAEDACPGTAPSTPVDDVGCSDAQRCGPDDDGDGKVNSTDHCPGTPAGKAIDDGGCSITQFCGAQNATTATGRASCKKLDWKNDEPLMRSSASNCVVNGHGPGTGDDICEARLIRCCEGGVCTKANPDNCTGMNKGPGSCSPNPC